ncbi:MAG: tetratricopeptide repeat protein [Melioribacteraceae bacterium]|nr:tetratricopeptide repeat protein [Melioribacteraceae bacterium]
MQKSYADSLFQSERFFDAITEYKRLQFFSNSEEYNYSSNFKIALCYKAGAKYDDAIKYFNIAKTNSNNVQDSINTELQIIRTNILRRTIPEALSLLKQIDEKYPNKIDSSTINYWSGWAYILNDDWDLASKEFEKINNLHPLKTLADSVDSEKYSVTFAKVSSFIIPGSGQFYTGNYLSGIMSLGWDILWGYLTINAFVTDRAVEGILIGSLLWTRFYKGNFQNAERFAVERNKEISNKAYQYLAKKYIGEKP